ncbi:hypothetical protein EYF80_012417 [Liparis tanakae]|uniref:Uncharacterized protein n=1 Tax=Liparis tanakae TaxID=230148 RepID=A0A4Z2IJE8_9TELE|nr:hypothetical protein EYF80_012417 [Liparis tanakae]
MAKDCGDNGPSDWLGGTCGGARGGRPRRVVQLPRGVEVGGRGRLRFDDGGEFVGTVIYSRSVGNVDERAGREATRLPDVETSGEFFVKHDFVEDLGLAVGWRQKDKRPVRVCVACTFRRYEEVFLPPLMPMTVPRSPSGTEKLSLALMTRSNRRYSESGYSASSSSTAEE